MLIEVRLIRDRISPNFTRDEVDVEFLVLHYTGCDLEKTFEIFLDPKRAVTSHFVIDVNGDIYDLGGIDGGVVRRGAHAGVSRIEVGEKSFQSLNHISIGIEIVNLNGNYLEYPEAQYSALVELTRKLQETFPKLRDPERITGHEQIAGFRGKCDPGRRFNWAKYFAALGLTPRAQHAFHAATEEDVAFISEEIRKFAAKPTDREFWPALSTRLEEKIKARMSAGF